MSLFGRMVRLRDKLLGKRYALRLEYVQPNSGKLISLSWSSTSQTLEVIPAGRLTTLP